MRAGRPRSQVMVIAAWCAMRMTVSREHRLLEQGGWGNRVSPPPACGRAWPSSRGYGETGFPYMVHQHGPERFPGRAV